MKKILLIEDNEDIRNNTAEILELANYDVRAAENGKKGIAAAMEFNPDLIICDIMMPELDGYGVLHAIQTNNSLKNTPFIFLTAKTERGDFRKGMESGADDYITKPFAATELLNAVDSRLKKIEILKQDALLGLDGLANLVKATSGKNPWMTLTEDRNIKKLKRKQIIYSEGNHPEMLYYVLSGKVKTFKMNDDGKELITNMFSSGDFLGHVALLEGTVYWDSAETLDETELLNIPKEEFEILIHNSTEVSRKFIQILAKNISIEENQLLAMASNSLRTKVADAILTIQKKYKNANDESFVIDMSRDSLATLAGTATEPFVRTLSDFRSEDLIDIIEGKIFVKNPKKLEKLLS